MDSKEQIVTSNRQCKSLVYNLEKRRDLVLFLLGSGEGIGEEWQSIPLVSLRVLFRINRSACGKIIDHQMYSTASSGSTFKEIDNYKDPINVLVDAAMAMTLAVQEFYFSSNRQTCFHTNAYWDKKKYQLIDKYFELTGESRESYEQELKEGSKNEN